MNFKIAKILPLIIGLVLFSTTSFAKTDITDLVDDEDQLLSQTGTVSETFKTRKNSIYIQIDKINNASFSLSNGLKNALTEGVNVLASSLIEALSHDTQSLLNFEYRENQPQEAPTYSRRFHFGNWVKNKKSGTCYNTRAKVLIRDNVGVIKFKDDNPCTVESGLWNDPYAGEKLTDAINEIQIDHMVPLKDAYISGAYAWNFKERCLYANYMGLKEHLVSASGEENNQKSDQTPVDYMPSNESFRCQYLKNWLTIKALWGLSMAPSEAKAIEKQIHDLGCNQNQFVINKNELQEQLNFFQKNINLCGGLEKILK